MTRRWLLVLGAAMLLPAMALAGQVSGRVFFDANGDGAWQQGEVPLPDALVSDGFTIVSTGPDGSYLLQCPDGPQVVFVVNPPGTWPTAGFYRNVSQYPATADFPLRHQEQTLPCYFVQGTDLHVRPDVAPLMARYVQAVNDLPMDIAFVVHTGDLVVDATATTVEGARSLFVAYREMVAGLKPPLFNLPGNHEHTAVIHPAVSPDTPGWGKALYRELLGPMYYAFRWGPAHFIALDGTDIVDGRLVYSIPDECLTWLAAYLSHVARSEPIVLLIHEPLQTLPQKERVAELLAGYHFLLALSGHGHGVTTWDFAGGKEIMAGATSYAWHGPGFGPEPMGYHVVRLSADGFQSAFADWAKPWSLRLRRPERSQPLRVGTIGVDAIIFDPREQIEAVDVSLGEGHTRITQLEAEGLCRKLSATLDTGTPAEGVYDLTFVMQAGQESLVEQRPVVLVGGPEEPFVPEGPVTLVLRGLKIDAANQVFVNGQLVGEMTPGAAERTRVELPVPADCLRRLNRVEVVSARDAQGQWDNFTLDMIEFSYQGRAYVDPLRSRYGGRAVVPTGDEPGRVVTYLDLTRPLQ